MTPARLKLASTITQAHTYILQARRLTSNPDAFCKLTSAFDHLTNLAQRLDDRYATGRQRPFTLTKNLLQM